jgi:secretion/DNA translocation related TadE-like protein
MAGAVLSVAIVGVAAAMTVGLASVGAAATFAQRLAGAADAAALAAADTAAGAVPGDPCDRADEVAGASRTVVTACEVADLTVTVTVSAPFGHFVANASARAGPPP